MAMISQQWLVWDGGTVARLALAYRNAEWTVPRPEGRAAYWATLDSLRKILADALEEAGCADADILGCLRDTTRYYQGRCSVIGDILVAVGLKDEGRLLAELRDR